MSIHRTFFGSVDLPSVDGRGHRVIVQTASVSSAGRSPARRRGRDHLRDTGTRRAPGDALGRRGTRRDDRQPQVEIELVPLRDNEVTRKAIAEARVEMIERGAGHEYRGSEREELGVRDRPGLEGRGPRSLPPR